MMLNFINILGLIRQLFLLANRNSFQMRATLDPIVTELGQKGYHSKQNDKQQFIHKFAVIVLAECFNFKSIKYLLALTINTSGKNYKVHK